LIVDSGVCMFNENIDPNWIDAFIRVFELCKLKAEERCVILSETHSREINIEITHHALARMGVNHYHIQVPTPAPIGGPIIRSSGASAALENQPAAVESLAGSHFVIDLTVEGLMHAPQTAAILKGGARILNISNEHPEALARLVPDESLKAAVRSANSRCREASSMRVTSDAGTELDVNLIKAPSVGVWGWTDRAGTLAHWPGGIVVCFPAAKSCNGKLVFQPGDINLTFKKYFDSSVTFIIEDDYVTAIEGKGADAHLMRRYLKGFGDREAYATSHVGWGLNPGARYEALTMYDQRETNGTELRAVAGNFLYSTGANEFAGRFTRGHFDLPMMGCTIALDGEVVVEAGRVV